MAKLIYPELSYRLMNILFKVHNKLGPKYQEKYYQRAIEIEFNKQKIPFEKEKYIRLKYEGENIGCYYIDFVIEKKIALEIKSLDYFKRDFTSQILAYLNTTNLRLGIIVNFNGERLQYRRYINPKYFG